MTWKNQVITANLSDHYERTSEWREANSVTVKIFQTVAEMSRTETTFAASFSSSPLLKVQSSFLIRAKVNIKTSSD